jgi:uncharacterized protein YjbI with pentapeptide repeats
VLSLQSHAVFHVELQRGVSCTPDGKLEVRYHAVAGLPFSKERIDLVDLASRAEVPNLVLILDGLDEIGTVDTHRSALSACAEFLAELANDMRFKDIAVIVSGRTQAIFNLLQQYDSSHVPQRLIGLAMQRIELVRPSPYIDNEHISYHFDNREAWLERYCAFKSPFGNPIDAPTLLKSFAGLDELSSEPLLMYLLARLAFIYANRHENVSFPLGAVFELGLHTGLTRNDIFSLLIACLRYPEHRESSGLEQPYLRGGLPEESFEETLACMAVAAWHGGTSRRGTVSAFLAEARAQGLENQAKRFLSVASGTIDPSIDPVQLSLLSVFYFQTSRQGREDIEEFEFTHKSFSSYLIARRFFLETVKLSWLYQEENEDRTDALSQWVQLVACGDEDPEVLNFLRAEIDRYHSTKDGFLTALGELGKIAKQKRGQAQTVEPFDLELLMQRSKDELLPLVLKTLPSASAEVALDAYKRCLRFLFAVWSSFLLGIQIRADESFEATEIDLEVLVPVLADRADHLELDTLYSSSAETSYFAEMLGHRNLSGYDFSGISLNGARFQHNDLSEAAFRLTALDHAQFQECLVEGVAFISCQMDGTHFFRSNGFALCQTVVRNSTLEMCRFSQVMFTQSEMVSCELRGCVFTECEFELINFEDTEFANTTFKGCNFDLCRFDDLLLGCASFVDCTFKGCNEPDQSNRS